MLGEHRGLLRATAIADDRAGAGRRRVRFAARSHGGLRMRSYDKQFDGEVAASPAACLILSVGGSEQGPGPLDRAGASGVIMTSPLLRPSSSSGRAELVANLASGPGEAAAQRAVRASILLGGRRAEPGTAAALLDPAGCARGEA
eukprot:tig00021339_g20425.t1